MNPKAPSCSLIKLSILASDFWFPSLAPSLVESGSSSNNVSILQQAHLPHVHRASWSFSSRFLPTFHRSLRSISRSYPNLFISISIRWRARFNGIKTTIHAKETMFLCWDFLPKVSSPSPSLSISSVLDRPSPGADESVLRNRIDCDAPADSTEIPYSHSHAPQSQLEQQQPTTSTRSQFPPRSHSRHTTRHSHQPTSKATTTSSKRKCMSVSVKRREKGDGKEKTVVRGSKTAGIIV